PELSAKRDELLALYDGKRVVIAKERLIPWLERLHLLTRRYGVGVTPPMADDANPGDISLVGSQLEGATARHPMHALGGFFAKPRPFLPGDFVTTE
ncbi:hypothetical protein EI056_26125, partial [Escherichia coli]|nr:hypothetical protein [Escherichia coli]